MGFAKHRTSTHAGEPSDTELVQAGRAGDLSAKELLFRRYATMVRGLVYRMTGNSDDVADMSQETFIEALTSLHKLEQPEFFAGWIGAIAIHTVSRALRRRQVWRHFTSMDDAKKEIAVLPTMNASGDAAADLRCVYKVLHTLPTGTRMALLLHRVEGHTLTETAQLLHVSLATVKRWLVRSEEALDRVRP